MLKKGREETSAEEVAGFEHGTPKYSKRKAVEAVGGPMEVQVIWNQNFVDAGIDVLVVQLETVVDYRIPVGLPGRVRTVFQYH